jgi:hypothetical protein
VPRFCDRRTSVNPACSAANTVGYIAANPNAKYIEAGVGASANLGRNTFNTQPFNISNLALRRTFRLTEQASLQFRMEAHDVFKDRNFTVGTLNEFPSGTNALNPGYASLAGVPTDTFLNAQLFNGGSRRIQFALKFSY